MSEKLYEVVPIEGVGCGCGELPVLNYFTVTDESPVRAHGMEFIEPGRYSTLHCPAHGYWNIEIRLERS